MQPLTAGSRHAERRFGGAEPLPRPRFLARAAAEGVDRHASSRGRSAGRRSGGCWSRRLGLFAGVVGIVGAGLVALHAYFPRAFTAELMSARAVVDKLAVASGFGIAQVSVVGHTNTSDGAIYAALDGLTAHSIFFADFDEARKRVERLAWVKRAIVTRVLPSDVLVQIVERQPYAVWRRRNLFFLIDDQGRELEPVPPRAYRELPLVLGEGAGPEAAALLTPLGKRRDLFQQVAAVERFGERRWSLHLEGGTIVHLPEVEPERAVVRFANLPNRAAILARKPRVIDLRLQDRVVVRLRPNDAKARAKHLQARRDVAPRRRVLAQSSRRSGEEPR